MFQLVRSSLLGAVALLAIVAPAQAQPHAATAGPQLGFYNCYSRGYPMVYQGTVQLSSGGRYAWGYLDTAKRRLKDPQAGAYRTVGNRITWSGGGLARLYGVVKAARKFEIWARGEQFSSYTCYFKF